MTTDPRPVLVTGATGYVGGRLAPLLLDRGVRVRCLARDARKLESRDWCTHPLVEIVEGDASDAASLRDAMDGCRAAYYLIHSMVSAGDTYRHRDHELAETFAHAAEASGVERIIYLGGLGELGDGLSEHLASRREVEDALASTEVPVTVLRAAMIIGSGSASFEILRYLVERLPMMITPRWVHTECQPIGIRNALGYLADALDEPRAAGRVLDIGGPTVLTYRQLMDDMASALGLRRRIVLPVPVLSPELSSRWIHLVTPVSRHYARPLAEGLRNRVVARNDLAQRLLPQPLISVGDAIRYALGRRELGDVETTWLDGGVIPGDPDWAGGTTYHDERSVTVDATPAEVFRAIRRIGGTEGWLTANVLWRVRGALDRMVGGPGLTRGRRTPDQLRFGDVVDFWRVTRVVPDRHLMLRAEMKLPGEATLSFDVRPGPEGTELVQTARFHPRGLLGILYWYAVMPFHGLVFRGMLTGLQRRAEEASVAPAPR